jgi:hypothetical protein
MNWYWYPVLLLFFAACQTVTTTDRVVYEDGAPANFAQVREWSENFESMSYTDKNGVWKTVGPAGEEVSLCIEDRRYGGEACWNPKNGKIMLPLEDGNHIIKERK